MPFCPPIKVLFHTDVIIAFDFIRGDFYILFYERGNQMKEIITIQISKFLSNEIVKKIAQKQWKGAVKKQPE